MLLTQNESAVQLENGGKQRVCHRFPLYLSYFAAFLFCE